MGSNLLFVIVTSLGRCNGAMTAWRGGLAAPREKACCHHCSTVCEVMSSTFSACRGPRPLRRCKSWVTILIGVTSACPTQCKYVHVLTEVALTLSPLLPARATQIAEHVLGQHRYRVPGDDGFTTGSLAQDRCARPCAKVLGH